jgi:hypothetical protein
MLVVDPTVPENSLAILSLLQLHSLLLFILVYYFILVYFCSQTPTPFVHHYMELEITYKYSLVNSNEGHKYLYQYLSMVRYSYFKTGYIYMCTCNHQ